MNRIAAEKYLIKLNQCSTDLLTSFGFYIAQQKNDIDLKFNDHILDGFNDLIRVIEKFHNETGKKLNYMKDTDEIDDTNKEMLTRINMLELDLSCALDLLKENNIPLK